jgi:NarL family two-component system response regulator LiaR
MAISMTIADDHALFRQGLRSLLALEPDLNVIAEFDRADDLHTLLSNTPCEILLLDLQMDRWSMDDIPALARLTSVIVLTASESVENGMMALQRGALAYVQKRFAIDTLVTAIHAVAEGHVWMPPAVQAAFARPDTSITKRLTRREAEIVRCVALGMRNAEVAEYLSVTENTVKTHLTNIFQKLDVRHRLELARYAIRTGLVTLQNR